MGKIESLKKHIIKLIIFLKFSGILKSLYLINNKFKTPYLYRTTASRIKSRKGFPNDIKAHGVSFDFKELAIIKCLGEILERLYSSSNSEEKIFFTSFNKIKLSAIKPSDYTSNKKVDTEIIGWVKGYNLTLKRPAFIPGQLVYSNYIPRHKELSFFGLTQIGSGVASGPDFSSVILNGIYEIIERDGFMTSFLNRIALPQLNIDKIIDPKIKSFLKKFRHENRRMLFFDITNDLSIPTFFTLIFDESIKKQGKVFPVFAIGLKSNINPAKAIKESIEESFLEWLTQTNYVRSKNFNYKKIMPQSNHIMTIDDLKKLYLSAKIIKMENSSPIKNFAPDQELRFVLKKLRIKGLEVYYKNISPKKLQEINYFIYRTFIPFLQPLCFYKDNMYINENRLRKVRQYFKKN